MRTIIVLVMAAALCGCNLDGDEDKAAGTRAHQGYIAQPHKQFCVIDPNGGGQNCY